MRAALEVFAPAIPATALLAWLDRGGSGLAIGLAVMTAVAASVLVARRRAGLGDTPLGWPNRVTLLRGHLAAVLLASLAIPVAPWTLAAIVLAAVASDALDGWLARRLGAVSAFGARLDMETDAALMLVLCVVLVAQGRGHGTVVIVGVARYAFVAAGQVLPALRAPLLASGRRRLAAASVMVLLAAAFVPLLPPPVAIAATVLATAITVVSFAIDVAWLLRREAGA